MEAPISARGASRALIALGVPLAATIPLLPLLAGLGLRLGLVTAGLSAVVIGTLVHRPRHARPFWLLAGALASSLLGDVVALVSQVRGSMTGPALVDVWLTTVAAVLLVVAVLDARGRARHRDLGGLLDAFVISLAAGTIAWTLLVVAAAAPGWVGSAAEVLGSVQILAIAALIALLGRSYRRLPTGGRTATGLAIAALICVGAAFLVGAAAAAGGLVPYTSARSFFGATANLLMGAAALHPSMRAFTDNNLAPSTVEPLTRRRVVWLGLALTAPVLVLALAQVSGLPHSLVDVAVVWLLLVPAVVGRLYLLGRDHAAAERRTGLAEQRLTERIAQTGDLLLLVHPAGSQLAIDYASPAARMLLDREPNELIGRPVVELVAVPDREAFEEILRHAPTRLATADLRALTAAGDERWVQAIVDRFDAGEHAGTLVVTLRDIVDRKIEEQRWIDAALRDPGTGLANRRGIEERLAATFPEGVADQRSGTVGILMCDLDDFKVVNDDLGHLAGDAVLREVAERLRGAVRDDDLVGRFGGDEFLIVCRVDDGRDALERLAERIVAEIGRPYTIEGRQVTLGCSVGVLDAGGCGRPVGWMLAEVDRAMYRAKARGKNQVAWGTCPPTTSAHRSRETAQAG